MGTEASADSLFRRVSYCGKWCFGRCRDADLWLRMVRTKVWWCWGAKSRAFDSNAVDDRVTYFAVMGLLQDTC